MLNKLKDEYKNIKNIRDHIYARNLVFENYKNKKINKELKFIKDKIDNQEYKGIIVYPQAVMWDPIQRPHHFLRKMGEKGYLCFFCEWNEKEDYLVKEKFKNVYLINKEENLIPLLKDQEVIFYITYFLQYIYSLNFKNKISWVDILDRIDFFSAYNLYTKKIWKKLIKEADVLTYSARNLKRYTQKRKDALLLPNAANPEDFIIKRKKMPDDIKDIVAKKKKIIGYFGAIEEWFDFDLIKKIDSKLYEIILIGNNNIKTNKVPKNIHFIGAKKFEELKYYANYFDIAIIPFKINNLTNDVSPVKFFEYMALSKPVISTKIYEMSFYKSKVLKLIDENNRDNINDLIEELLKLSKEEVKLETSKILNDNTWEHRCEEVIKAIEGSKTNG